MNRTCPILPQLTNSLRFVSAPQIVISLVVRLLTTRPITDKPLFRRPLASKPSPLIVPQLCPSDASWLAAKLSQPESGQIPMILSSCCTLRLKRKIYVASIQSASPTGGNRFRTRATRSVKVSTPQFKPLDAVGVRPPMDGDSKSSHSPSLNHGIPLPTGRGAQTVRPLGPRVSSSGI